MFETGQNLFDNPFHNFENWSSHAEYFDIQQADFGWDFSLHELLFGDLVIPDTIDGELHLAP